MGILIMFKCGYSCCRKKAEELQNTRHKNSSETRRTRTLPPLAKLGSHYWPRKVSNVASHYYPEASPNWDVTTL